MAYKVRTHTRRMKGGGTTTVRQHKRGGPNPSHAWQTGRKAYRAHRGGRHAAAAAFVLWAGVEFGLWAAFNLTGVLFGLLGALLVVLSVVMVRRWDGQRASGRW